jgi:hypothetical protein
MSKNTDLGSLVNYIKGQVTGRLNAPAYTSATAFTGTIAGYLGFDTSGNILTTAGGITGSGTINYIPKFTASGTIGNSQIFDNGTNVGIGTNSPLSAVNTTTTIIGTIINQTSAAGASYNENIRLNRNANNDYSSIIIGGAYNSTIGTSAGQWAMAAYPIASGSPFVIDYNGIERLRFQSGGNVSIGNTNNTYKLDVTGDVNISGTYRVNGTAIGGVTGSGSTNFMPLWTSTTGLGNSIIYNASGNLGINSTTNGYTLNAIRSASTEFNAVYKGSGSLIQIMARFMKDESSNYGIAIGYASPTWGASSGVYATQEGALKLGVKDGIFYRAKIQMTNTDIYLDIPTSGGGLSSGAIWNDGGTVKIAT